ncbi:MAG: chorismate synthase [Candidatus Heimdallarchaeota archaeon]|nr:chorismate synthase [Candidatus Heimdallarchaeota archaeon]
MHQIGQRFQITLIGSSHGNLVGASIQGVPPGIHIDTTWISKRLSQRRPGQSAITTQRDEKDELILETGIIDGITTGEPILAYTRNRDVDSTYYDEIRHTPRPGHADYPAEVKYKGFQDHRGSGRFSGRMTIGLVIAGAIAEQILQNKGISTISYTKELGGIEAKVLQLEDEVIQANLTRSADPSVVNQQIALIEQLREEGDSCGGIVETVISGLPVGVGEPFFYSIESSLAQMLFSIPAVKAVEFGMGFAAARSRGSVHNDGFYLDPGVKTRTNHAGGILGGLSTGMPVTFRVGIKPTSSIAKIQDTVDLNTMRETTIKVRGRHDPCIVPRVVPVVQAATNAVILDLMLLGGFI